MVQQTTTAVADTAAPKDIEATKNALTKVEIKDIGRKNLFNLIDHTSEYRLRCVLKDIITKNGRLASSWVKAALLVCKSDVKPWVEGDDDLGSDWEESEGSELDGSDASQTDSDAETNGALPSHDATQTPISTVVLEPSAATAQIPKGNKRMRSRYATCANCKKEFDVSLNEKGNCRYHSEDYRIDEEAECWEDWDDFDPGMSMYDDEARERYPEGYFWGCCDKRGDAIDAEGCKVGRHREEKRISKKTKHS